MKTNDITIIYQGNSLPATYINNKKFNVLFSTYDNYKTNNSIITSEMEKSFPDRNNTFNNILGQYKTTIAGLNKCKTRYVVKCRSDIAISCGNFLKQLPFTKPTSYTFLERKIRITNFFVRDPLKVPYLFHISDCILFGRTDDMKKLWGATLPTPESLFQEGKGHLSLFGNEAGITRFREVPEQTICLRWLERMGYPVHLPHPCATSYEWFKLWENVLAANFEIVDADKSGILFPPHFYNADKRHKTLLTEANFKKMCKAPGTRRRYARLLFHKYIAVWFSPRYWAVTGWLFMNRLTPSLAECIRKLAKKR